MCEDESLIKAGGHSQVPITFKIKFVLGSKEPTKPNLVPTSMA